MPRKLPHGRVAMADQIATLWRIYRAANRSGDFSLRDASASELRTKYGIEVTYSDCTNSEYAITPVKNTGGEK